MLLYLKLVQPCHCLLDCQRLTPSNTVASRLMWHDSRRLGIPGCLLCAYNIPIRGCLTNASNAALHRAVGLVRTSRSVY